MVYTCTVNDTEVVIMIGSPTTPDMITAIKRHYYEDSYRRWKRLGLNMTHLIPDLFYLFVDWASMLASLKRILRDAEVRSISGSVPVTVHTRILHHQIAAVIKLRESLRFHQAVIDQTMNSQKQGWGVFQDISGQLDRMKKSMAHNAITLDTIKDQLANLIQLVSYYPFSRYDTIASTAANLFVARSSIWPQFQKGNQFLE